VSEVSWSRLGNEDCIRIEDVGADADTEVRVRAGRGNGLDADVRPSMGGRTVRDGRHLCFVPRFPFVDGTPYTVSVHGVPVAVLVRPRAERVATADVIDIRPSALEVPRNILRFSVRFSAPMRDGDAADHVGLVDDDGTPIDGALLPVEYELWDTSRRRLTVLLDPARIKRGLVPHRQLGYPLRTGSSIRLVVDDGLRDARGEPLRHGASRAYVVTEDERRRVEPARWAVREPGRATLEPFHVSFDRPLDHALLGRCLHVVGPDGEPVDGTRRVGRHERSWALAPAKPWRAGRHHLVVDPALEDLAGNSVGRVFDRDLHQDDDQPHPGSLVALSFEPVDA
jgi:hypothetical protein